MKTYKIVIHKEIDCVAFLDLDEETQAKVMERFVSTLDDPYLYENDYDYWIDQLDAAGIDVRPKDVHWSGFYNQGDGLAFEAHTVDLEKFLATQCQHYDRQSYDLLLEGIKLEYLEAYAQGSTHGYCQYAGVEYSSIFCDDYDGWKDLEYGETNKRTAFDQAVKQLEKDFAEYCQDKAAEWYRALCAEYDYQFSKENYANFFEASERVFDPETGADYSLADRQED